MNHFLCKPHSLIAEQPIMSEIPFIILVLENIGFHLVTCEK